MKLLVIGTIAILLLFISAFTLPLPLVVNVIDVYGKPVSGAEVQVTYTSLRAFAGDVSFNLKSATTGTEGRAIFYVPFVHHGVKVTAKKEAYLLNGFEKKFIAYLANVKLQPDTGVNRDRFAGKLETNQPYAFSDFVGSTSQSETFRSRSPKGYWDFQIRELAEVKDLYFQAPQELLEMEFSGDGGIQLLPSSDYFELLNLTVPPQKGYEKKSVLKNGNYIARTDEGKFVKFSISIIITETPTASIGVTPFISGYLLSDQQEGSRR